MRTNAARGLAWEMIVDKNCTEMNIPGTMMKNGKPLTLALVGQDGKPIFDFLTKEAKAKSSALIFDITEARLRNEWRKACDAKRSAHIAG